MERVVVCLKPVPDPKEWHRLKLDPESGTLIREGLASVINPLDKHALEAALTVKDAHGAEVVIISMAPASTAGVLREALAMGADRAVLLSDRVFAGSDTLATARILAAGIRQIGNFDLICCGNSTLDGSTAQVPAQVAEMLGIPSLMHVRGMEWSGPELLLTQQTDGGIIRWKADLPLLLSFNKEANTPRFISFLEILAAEERELAVRSNQDLGLDPAMIGLSGSPTRMADLVLREKRRQGRRIEGTPDEIAGHLVDVMYQMGVL